MNDDKPKLLTAAQAAAKLNTTREAVIGNVTRNLPGDLVGGQYAGETYIYEWSVLREAAKASKTIAS